jgi:hypothetical protein
LIDSTNKQEQAEMATALQKPSNSELTTVQQLYRQQWAQAFAEVMDIIAQRWKLVLYQKVPEGGEAQPAPLLLIWRDSLNTLSPSQMREGLRLYLCSENGHFEPSPGDIIVNAPTDAFDRPKKVMNPNCQECEGSGLRKVKAKSKIHPDKTVFRYTDCFCVRIHYAGEVYTPAQRQLEAAKPDQAKVEKINQQVEAAAPGKRFPGSQYRGPLSEAEVARQKELVKQKYGAK